MSLFVKICGLSNVESIAAAVDAGADAIGFVFADSPRRVSASRAAELARDIPDHVKRVAVTKHPDRAELNEVLRTFEPDYLQSDAADFAAISLPSYCAALPVHREAAGLNAPAVTGTRILFEGRVSGSGQTADWNEARALAQTCELLLAGGLNIDNVAAAINHVRPWGVDVSSGVEKERGKKDAGLIREFIACVRAQENTID